jgi:hypothetical protein
MDPRDLGRAYAGGRLAIGVLLVLFPRRIMAGMAGGPDQVTPALVLVTRLLGVRDAILGAGTLAAVAEGDAGRVRTWMTYGAVADAGDALSTLAGYRHLPRFKRFGLLALASGGAGAGAYLRTAPPAST